MSTPSPALVTQAAVRRLPPLALVLFVLCYVMAGFWGREPWKTIDMGSLGVMLDLVSGRSSWMAPTFLGQTPEAPALLNKKKDKEDNKKKNKMKNTKKKYKESLKIQRPQLIQKGKVNNQTEPKAL